MCGCGKHPVADDGTAGGRQGTAERGGAPLSRRGFLATATVAGAAGAVTLAPVRFACAATGGAHTQTIGGHFDVGVPDFVYVPVEVPAGVAQIDVSYSYNRPTVPAGVPGNALDIGIFDERGTTLGKRAGFRGWSGGFRTSFSISNSDATPGYLPGPVNPGTWHVAFGPYTVAPSGLDWTLQITLSYGPPGPALTPPTTRQQAPRAAAEPGTAATAIVHATGD